MRYGVLIHAHVCILSAKVYTHMHFTILFLMKSTGCVYLKVYGHTQPLAII